MAGGWGGSQVVGISTLGSRVAPPAGRPQDDIQPSEQTETSSDGTLVDTELARRVQTFPKHFGRSLWGRGVEVEAEGCGGGGAGTPAILVLTKPFSLNRL